MWNPFGANFFVMLGKVGNPALHMLLLHREGEAVGMARADDYRRYAAECLALAQRAKTPQDRARLLEMAHDWKELAAKAGRSQDDSQNDPQGGESGG
jgi:hypothetical protein